MHMDPLWPLPNSCGPDWRMLRRQGHLPRESSVLTVEKMASSVRDLPDEGKPGRNIA